jgi:roadblock/LC7 domain-containing protein
VSKAKAQSVIDADSMSFMTAKLTTARGAINGKDQVKYTEYPGLDHVPAIEQARTDPAFLEWLLAQRRN